jgi:hypothetical protein
LLRLRVTTVCGQSVETTGDTDGHRQTDDNDDDREMLAYHATVRTQEVEAPLFACRTRARSDNASLAVWRVPREQRAAHPESHRHDET